MTKTQGEINKSIGRKIKYLRLRSHETQEELARGINLSLETIKGYEQGKRNPGEETLGVIGRRYGVDHIDLFPDPEGEDVVPLSHFNRTVPDSVDIIAAPFPVFYSDEMTLSRDMFEAIRCHLKLIKQGNLDIENKEIDACLERYRKSVRKDDDEAVSTANRLSLLMLREYLSASYRAAGDLNGDAVKTYSDALRIEAKIKYKRQLEIDGIPESKKDHIRELIQELYSNPSTMFSEIGHYFTALSVILGFDQYRDSSYAREMIGASMMIAIAAAGNEYALDYLIEVMDPLMDDD